MLRRAGNTGTAHTRVKRRFAVNQTSWLAAR